MLITALLATLTPLAPIANAGDECPASKASLVSTALEQDIVDTALAAGSFKTLAAALTAAELVDALRGKGPFTVFAPTDAAFAKLPKGTLEKLLKPENRAMLSSILIYHVVPGTVLEKDVAKLSAATTLNGQRIDVKLSDDGVRIDGAMITKTDIRCSNGVIHVLDAVILPSQDDIVATAVKAGSFQTLVKALGAAELVDALQGEGPFTVFAPSDAAFAALPAGTLTKLLDPANKALLVQLLTYHVAPGRVYADQALAAGSVPTLEGSSVMVGTSPMGGVLIDDALVVRADNQRSNGVIHVIDAVLIPPGFTIP
jgi:uncharacterized surface protein with fasciclin (FAS1) repeats